MYLKYTITTLLLCSGLMACSDGYDKPVEVIPSTSLTVVPTAAPEGAPGEMQPLQFRVTISEPQSVPITVFYETTAGTASANVDYLSTAGSVELPPGAIDAMIQVDMIGDADEEAAETFDLAISIDGPATAHAETIIGTIANDDSSCDMPFSKTPNPWLVNGADPLNFAHRGGVTDFPENTLYAYAEAAAAGADVLEMDVFQTKDNELVILHDGDVDRTTNGTGRVVDLTLAELRTLDAAYWFVPDVGTPHDRPAEDYMFRGIATGDKPPPPGYSAEDFRIPTLEDILTRFPRDRINLDLKQDLDGTGDYEQQTANLLQAYGRSTDVIVVSFVDQASENFKAVAPCVYTAVPLQQASGLVLGSQGDGIIPPVSEHIAFQVPPDTSQIGDQVPDDFFLTIVTPDFVADSHAANLPVHVWTINTCEEMLRMIGLKVDGIMTDQPILLAEVLATPPDQRTCE